MSLVLWMRQYKNQVSCLERQKWVCYNDLESMKTTFLQDARFLSFLKFPSAWGMRWVWRIERNLRVSSRFYGFMSKNFRDKDHENYGWERGHKNTTFFHQSTPGREQWNEIWKKRTVLGMEVSEIREIKVEVVWFIVICIISFIFGIDHWLSICGFQTRQQPKGRRPLLSFFFLFYTKGLFINLLHQD